MKLFLCVALIAYVWIGNSAFGADCSKRLPFWEQQALADGREPSDLDLYMDKLDKALPGLTYIPFSVVNVDRTRIDVGGLKPPLHYTLTYDLHRECKGITAIFRNNLALRDLEFLQALFLSKRIKSIALISKKIDFDIPTMKDVVVPCRECAMTGFTLYDSPESGISQLSNLTYHTCYDGDTCTFTIPNTHPLLGEKISVRVLGIDTPEIRGKCPQEKQLAKEARDVVRGILQNAGRIDLKEASRGKYFRIVARVEVDGVDLSTGLINQGLAVQYDGGTKTKDWCE